MTCEPASHGRFARLVSSTPKRGRTSPAAPVVARARLSRRRDGWACCTEVHLNNGARGLVAGALALAAIALGGGAAQAAADPVITVGADGKTAPVFSYADAV